MKNSEESKSNLSDVEERRRQFIERTLVLLKPDAVERGLTGEIIKRFEQRGLKIVALKMLRPSKEIVEEHYAPHKGKPFYAALVNYLSSGVVVAMVIEGIRAVEAVRKMVGPTDPLEAPMGTIRGDFSHVPMEYADMLSMSLKNLVHASSSKEEAEREIRIWFSPDEIQKYRRVEEVHIFGW